MLNPALTLGVFLCPNCIFAFSIIRLTSSDGPAQIRFGGIFLHLI